MVALAELPRHPWVASACAALWPRGQDTGVVVAVSSIERPSTSPGLGGTLPFGYTSGTPWCHRRVSVCDALLPC
jgi:hypothetical protein